MMSLSICYAANLGGTATIIGTAPNLILIENLEDFPDQPLTFLSWMGFAIPMALLLLLCAWAWLQMYFMGIPKPSNKKMKKEDMGKEKKSEKRFLS